MSLRDLLVTRAWIAARLWESMGCRGEMAADYWNSFDDCPTPEDHHNLTPSPAFPLWQLTAVVDLDFWYSRCKPWFHLPAGMTGKSPQRSALKLVHFNRPKFSQILLQDFFIFFIKQESPVYLNGAMPSSRKKTGQEEELRIVKSF